MTEPRNRALLFLLGTVSAILEMVAVKATSERAAYPSGLLPLTDYQALIASVDILFPNYVVVDGVGVLRGHTATISGEVIY